MLEHYLNKENVDIAMLSEHWLKPNEQINISNFKISTYCRINGHGGVAFVINNKITYKETKMKNYLPIETIEIETQNLEKNLILISIYIPPNTNFNLTKKQFKNLINDYNQKNNVLIAGDINAHHHLWEYNSKPDNRGIAIADILNTSNFVTLNNGEHTYIKEDKTSAIDIAIAHTDIAQDCEWEKIFENLNSDHFITQTYYNSKINNYQIPKPSAKINYKKLISDLADFNTDNIDTIEEFQEKIETMTNQNTFETQNDNKYIPKYWWTEKIRDLWEIKRQKLKLYNRYKTQYTKIEFKKYLAKLKLEIKKSKKEKFQEFIEDINPNADIKSIYQKINIFNNKKRKKENYNFSDNQIKDFINFNYKNFQNNYKPIFNSRKIKENDYLSFKKDEIENIIKKNKNTAPGHNKISNKILKLLNNKSIDKITYLLNKTMMNQKYPKNWKIIKIVPILKPNKIQTDIKSYRPIALINTIAKLFNKLIKIRLDDHLETNNILPPLTFGFRKNKSTHECISYILHEINKNTSDNIYTMVIVTDITKAFDHIVLETLIKELNTTNFNTHYINMISQFLYNRKYILSNNNITEFKTVYDGLPQGSTLSTTLFNIYTKNLHSLNNNQCQIVQFADDITILIKSNSITNLLNTATHFVSKFNTKLMELNLCLNIEKCSSVLFNHHTEMFDLLDIKVNNITIKNKKHVQILGITIDNRLNFNLNTKILKENCSKTLNILKIFSKCRGGASPQTMLNINKALVNSRINYSTLLSNLNKTNIKIVQTIQNNAIRICMGYIKTTPNPTILAESCQLPFEKQDEINTARFLSRQISNNNHIREKLASNTSIKKFQTINDKYNIINLTPIKSKITPNNTNIKIIKNNNNRNITNNEKKDKINLTIKKYVDEDYFTIFTDGSKTHTTNGIGIYFKNTGETFSFNVADNLSIKCLEIFAILLAIKLSLKLNKKKIIIFTDSLSSLISIENCMKLADTKRYVETKLLNAINNNNMETILHWIPAHIDVIDHDLADKAAKNATNNLKIEKLPINEILNNIKTTIQNDWINIYNDMTQNKGLFYKHIINGTPRRTQWFKNCNFSSHTIKLLNRLRSGHSFDKKTLNIMRIENTNLCETCNVVENAEHIILTCTKYNTIRLKYKTLSTQNYTSILRNENTYLEITQFLKEIKYNL